MDRNNASDSASSTHTPLPQSQYPFSNMEATFHYSGLPSCPTGSIYTYSASPSLLRHVSSFHPTVDVRGPLTPVLGLFIAAQATPHVEGTGGLYLAEGGDSKEVLLITARNVLFPSNEGLNTDYTHTNTSMPHHNVILLGTQAFDNLLKSIKIRIRRYDIMAEFHNRQIQMWKRKANENKDKIVEAMRELERAQGLLNNANKAIEALDKFHDEVMKEWSQPSQRVLGHIIHASPTTLCAGMEGFTEDYAIIKLDSSKIKKVFMGNMIDLGTKISMEEFILKIYDDCPGIFVYPVDRLLQLQGLIQEDHMHNPDIHDRNGHATGIFSFIRQNFDNGTHRTSKEWAILSYDHKSGVFSAPGDSGSIIADIRGRIGGLLTGGAGKTESSDITYATPLFWLLPRIKSNGFPNAHLYPAMT